MLFCRLGQKSEIADFGHFLGYEFIEEAHSFDSYCPGLPKLAALESCAEGSILILTVIHASFSRKFDSCGLTIRAFQGSGYIASACLLRVAHDRGLGGITKENENSHHEYREKKERKGINLPLILFHGLSSPLTSTVVFLHRQYVLQVFLVFPA